MKLSRKYLRPLLLSAGVAAIANFTVAGSFAAASQPQHTQQSAREMARQTVYFYVQWSTPRRRCVRNVVIYTTAYRGGPGGTPIGSSTITRNVCHQVRIHSFVTIARQRRGTRVTTCSVGNGSVNFPRVCGSTRVG